MKIADVMTSDVSVCLPHEPLQRAAQIMWDEDRGCVPVIDGCARLLGMVTDRDVCMSMLTNGGRMDTPVEHAMSRPVWSCRDDDELRSVHAVMRAHQVRRLPVTDAAGRVVGLVSLSDIARAARGEPPRERMRWANDVLETLAEATVPRCNLKRRAILAFAGLVG